MAVVYKIASDAYSTVATWYSAGSPYGQLPQVGDYVYANGYVIVLDVDFNIGIGTISTEICPYTGLGGGGFTYGASRILTCNVVAGATTCITQTTITRNIILVGNITGGSVSTAYGIYILQTNTGTSTATVIGNITSNIGSGMYFYLQGSITRLGVLNLTGNMTSSATALAVLVLSDGLFTLVQSGNATSGGSLCANNVNTLDFTGTAAASPTSSCFHGKNVLSTAVINGVLINSGSYMAVWFAIMTFAPATYSAWKFYTPAGVEKMLYTAEALENPPAESDTRSGVVYGIANNYTGTAAIPPAASVLIGVPVDTTVGSWAFDTNLITRLEKCATVQDVNDTVSAFNV